MKSLILGLFFLIFTGCGSKVVLPEQKVALPDNKDKINEVFVKYKLSPINEQDILKKEITYPKSGELNSYEIMTDDKLEAIYKNYLSGNAEEALSLIKQTQSSYKDSKLLWQVSMLKMKILVMMGLPDDAVLEYDSCQKYEKLSFNSNLNCLALRGETNVWNSDFKQARKDLTSVLKSIGEWELPTSYMSPPSNMAELVAVATAQLRAYTSIAAMYILQENYQEAYRWAQEADKRYNAVIYVSNHWLYGKFLNIHLDTYYGKASNLTFLAAAKLAQKDELGAKKDFEKAMQFFKMINYKKGIATVLAFKARVYNRTGEYNKCEEAGEIALGFSLKNGFLDFIWRIEALRGETFAKLGDEKRAESSYRQAMATINSLSSSHSNDLSKRRFGFNKDDITLALLNIDRKNKDYKQLFVDSEQSRARAFVDMLSKRTIKSNNKNLNKIYQLDKEINRLQILNSAVTQDESFDSDRLNSLIHERQLLFIDLKKQAPKLSNVAGVWSISLEEIQKNLSDNYLLYFLAADSDSKIDYLLISKDDIKHAYLESSYKELDGLLKKLSGHLGIDSIQVRSLKKRVKAAQIEEDSFQGVLKSLNTVLKISELNTKSVYVVVNDSTSFIPWAMLDIGYLPTIVPTASWLNLESVTIDSNKAVVIGDPSFGGDAVQLEGAKSEAISVAKEMKVKALLGEDATKKRLYESVKGGVDILHLATHGIFYKNRPLESSLLLSDGKRSDALSAIDIYENPLKSNLVVLSACDSGLGSSASEQDYLGLSRSFFLGGTKAILSSLYSIDDKGTAEFMKNFYKYSKGGNYLYGYKRSVQELKKKGFSPSVYGAFVLQGLNKIEK